MLLFWRIRYLDRNDKSFKDRDLFLDTGTLSTAERSAVEIVVEMGSRRSEREFLKLRHLFREEKLGDISQDRLDAAGKTKSFCLPDYFEDETGREIEPSELWSYLKPVGQVVPDDAPEPKPIPLAEVTLGGNEVRILGYFTRDMKELGESAFMKEGPGTLTSIGNMAAPSNRPPEFETTLTEAEIISFVTVFRRLYMDREEANFKKAVGVLVRAIGDHPFARRISWPADEYEKQLESPCKSMPFLDSMAWTFTTKRLIDVFLYTRYAHQPDARRQRQYEECLAQVHGKRGLLYWLFLNELFVASIHILNAGRAIDSWFQRYCVHHGVTPDVLDSLRHEGIEFGGLEKEEARRARLIREKVEELEMVLWKRAGRPEGGPVQFRAAAQEQIERLLRGGDGA